MNKELIVSVKQNGKIWVLQDDFHFYLDDTIIVVPKGFETDFATTPMLVDFIFGYEFKFSKANVIHDYLYSTKKYDRKTSDYIYYKSLIKLGISTTKSRIAYLSVRIFGNKFWNLEGRKGE